MGLIDHWGRQQSYADPTPCLSENLKKKKKGETNDNRKRLSLKDLSGAFVVLIIGYILSSLAFIIERSIGRMLKDYGKNKITPISINPQSNIDIIVENTKQNAADPIIPTINSVAGDSNVGLFEEIKDEILKVDQGTKPAAKSPTDFPTNSHDLNAITAEIE